MTERRVAVAVAVHGRRNQRTSKRRTADRSRRRCGNLLDAVVNLKKTERIGIPQRISGGICDDIEIARTERIRLRIFSALRRERRTRRAPTLMR